MRKLSVCLFILLLLSCSGDGIPPEVMPINQMKTIMWDMSLADNLASDKYQLKKDSQRIMVTGLYQKVFSLHKTSKAQFYKSYAYYEAHPPVLQTLFDSIATYGTRQKTEVYKRNL